MKYDMQTKEELLKWYDRIYCLKQVKYNGRSLQYVQNQTKEIYLAVFNQNPEAIKFINIKKYPDILEKYLFMND